MKKNYLVLLFSLFISALSFAQKTDSSGSKEILLKDVVSIEVEPEFPGGNKAWSDFVSKNLKMGVAYANRAPAGRYKVKVEFFIEKDGSITEINPLSKHGYGMEKEVIRVIKKSPKWQPGSLNGEPTRKMRRQEITFVVSGGFE